MSFTSSNALWRSGDGVSNQFPVGLRVLVVDDDPTCLRILEKMLKNCLYEVTTCNRAEIALDFLRDTRNVYDIVISDVHMPDMDGFKLLEHVGLEMDLPVIMMSADDSKNVVMKGVTHGACDYLIKPVRMEALKNIWQHVFRKRKYEWKEKDLEESGSMEEQKISEDLDYSSSANEGNLNSSKRRKDDEDEVEDRDGTSESKKARVVWSIELHQQFVTAVNQLGIDKAVPKKILELMNVTGLSRENVASHLQKYRLYLRRLSCVSHHNGLPDSFIGPSDFPFGPMPPLNAVDRQALATSGQLTPQNLARIQAAALSRATATNEIPSQPHLVNQRNIFSFENPNLRYLDWPHSQQNNSSKQLKNLLHGTPTNMQVRPHANRNNPLLMPMVQTQNFNEVNSSVSQPILSRAIPSQQSPIVNFSSQSTDFQGNSFPLAKNTGMFCLSSRPQEEVNAEVKRCRGFIPSYAVLGSVNRDRTQDWCLQNVVSSVQGGQSRVGSVNRTAFSVAEGFGNTAIVGQQVNSSLADILLRNKVERMPNTGFQDCFLHEHVGQDELISALLREPHEGVGPIENEFGFDGYHLDNFYPV